jgi:hypothetical protein
VTSNQTLRASPACGGPARHDAPEWVDMIDVYRAAITAAPITLDTATILGEVRYPQVCHAR